MRRVIPILLLLMVPVMLVSADRDPGTMGIGIHGGIALPQGPEFLKENFNTGIGFGADFRYNINPTTALGLSYTLLSFKADEGKMEDMFFKPAADVTIEIDPVQVSVISANLIKYLTSPEASTGFFVSIGGGYYTAKSPEVKISAPDLGYEETIKSESESDFGINGGLGLEFKISKKMTFYASGEYHYIFTDDDEENDGGMAKSAADEDDSGGKTKVISIMGGIRYALGQ
jgi:opacity protein-like surface antigen